MTRHNPWSAECTQCDIRAQTRREVAEEIAAHGYYRALRIVRERGDCDA